MTPVSPPPGYAPFPVVDANGNPIPTGLLSPIQSYVYQEYSDDDDVQAFNTAQNALQQNYTDTFNGLNLPIYTGDPVSNLLLDWVAAGVYGMLRPSLSSGQAKVTGPYNTLLYNNFKGTYNALIRTGPTNFSYTTDDIFRRILTWHVSKSDGKYFSVRWLKRRVYQFLYGLNGIHINEVPTYQISIQFGPNSTATIRIVLGNGTINTSSTYNNGLFYYNKKAYNSINSTYVALSPVPNTAVFKEAADSGILELPFQTQWTIQIG